MERLLVVNSSQRICKLITKRTALTFCTRGVHSSISSRLTWLPRRLLLVRHGESAANVDREVYSQLPDWRISLTERGRAQSLDCGRRLRKIIQDEKLYIYYSPYERTRQTLHEIRKSFDENQIQGEREDERLREQEIGNYQPMSLMDKTWAERNEYGRLYYRFPCGESGADVGDRVSMFFDSLVRERVGLSVPNMNEGVMLDNSYYNVPPFPSDDVFSIRSQELDSCDYEDYDDKSINCSTFSKHCNERNVVAESLFSHQDQQEELEEELKLEETKQSTSSHAANTNVDQSEKYAKTLTKHCGSTQTEKLDECPSKENEINSKNVEQKSTSDNNNSNSAKMEQMPKISEQTFISNTYNEQIRSRNHDYTNWRFNTSNSNTIKDDHNVVIVSHGLLIRLFISRWYRLSTEVFETMCNPPNCSIIVMERNDNIGRMVMTDISKELFGSDPLLRMIRFDGVEDAEWHKLQLQNILNPENYAFDRPAEDDDENHYSKSAAHNTSVGAPAPPRRVTHLRNARLNDDANNSNAVKKESRMSTSDQQHIHQNNIHRYGKCMDTNTIFNKDDSNKSTDLKRKEYSNADLRREVFYQH